MNIGNSIPIPLSNYSISLHKVRELKNQVTLSNNDKLVYSVVT